MQVQAHHAVAFFTSLLLYRIVWVLILFTWCALVCGVYWFILMFICLYSWGEFTTVHPTNLTTSSLHRGSPATATQRVAWSSLAQMDPQTRQGLIQNSSELLTPCRLHQFYASAVAWIELIEGIFESGWRLDRFCFNLSSDSWRFCWQRTLCGTGDTNNFKSIGQCRKLCVLDWSNPVSLITSDPPVPTSIAASSDLPQCRFWV